MGRLFQNELLKMKYNKALWAFFGVIAAFAAIFGFAPGKTDSMNLAEYGYMASFSYMRNAGTAILLFLSPIAGLLFTQERHQGTMHNTLSCGVSRRQYFIVKLVCYLAIGVIIYLFSIIEFVCCISLRSGFMPDSGYPFYPYPAYGTAMLAYHFGVIIVMCTYMTFFIFIAVCVKKAAVVYILGALTLMGENILTNVLPFYRGVLPVIMDMYDMVIQRRILTVEFAGLFGQCLFMCFFFLGLAYLVFLRRDID